MIGECPVCAAGGAVLTLIRREGVGRRPVYHVTCRSCGYHVEGETPLEAVERWI